MERVVTNRRFPQQTVTLFRPVFGTEKLGVMPITFEDPVPLPNAICQPAGGDDLDLLPEGERLKNIMAVWSTAPMYVANGKDRDSDVLEFDGIRYTVMKMFNRSANGFYKVLAEGFVYVVT
jgi:hypothetical protein